MSPLVHLEPIGEDDRLRRGRDDPRRRLPPGLQPRLRLPRRAVLGLQVLPARGRGRAAAVLDVRPVRLRGGRRLQPAVPGDAGADETTSSSCCTSTPTTTGSRTRSATDARASSRGRIAHARHPPARARGARAGRLLVHPAGPVRRPLDAGRRRAALVLDGQPARRRADRAAHQVLRGRPVLEHARRRELSRGDELQLHRPLRRVPPARGRRARVMVAGGSGMAPVLSVLRQLSRCADRRPVRFFYGARAQRDLFSLDPVDELGAELPDFKFVPVLSDETATPERRVRLRPRGARPPPPRRGGCRTPRSTCAARRR